MGIFERFGGMIGGGAKAPATERARESVAPKNEVEPDRSVFEAGDFTDFENLYGILRLGSRTGGWVSESNPGREAAAAEDIIAKIDAVRRGDAPAGTVSRRMRSGNIVVDLRPAVSKLLMETSPMPAVPQETPQEFRRGPEAPEKIETFDALYDTLRRVKRWVSAKTPERGVLDTEQLIQRIDTVRRCPEYALGEFETMIPRTVRAADSDLVSIDLRRLVKDIRKTEAARR